MILRDHNKLILGPVTITASRWPWQRKGPPAVLSGPDHKEGDRYGWKPLGGMGRFGGGFEWNLGIEIGGSGSVHMYLLYGTVSIVRTRKCLQCGLPFLKGQTRGSYKDLKSSDGHQPWECHKECLRTPTPATSESMSSKAVLDDFDEVPF